VAQVVECQPSKHEANFHQKKKKKKSLGWAPVAHTGNPSYSGGKDRDSSSKPARANSLQHPISKKTHHKKKGLVEWLKV
jgi:hypothetical protein